MLSVSTQKDALIQILERENIMTVFQPVVSLSDGKVLGYEALSRGPRGSFLYNPDELFGIARFNNRLWELDYLCRHRAILSFAEKTGNHHDLMLFLNIDPAVIEDSRFRQGFTMAFIEENNLSPDQIVLEITEKSAVRDLPVFKQAIRHYTDQKFQLAIDDVGSGYSGLNIIAQVKPRFLKIDMDLIRDINQDQIKQTLVESLLNFCNSCNIMMIAEGIETQEELCTLVRMGVHYGQGYYISPPDSEIKDLPEAIISQICRYSGAYKNALNKENIIGVIAVNKPYLTSEHRGHDAADYFKNNPEEYSITVIEPESLRVTGLISRNNFYSKLGTRFGYDLYMNRAVSFVMDENPLIAEYNSEINKISQMAMSRHVDKLYQSIIITKAGKYYGIVSIKDILEHISKIKIEAARHINPLTQLPGNRLINEKIQETLSICTSERNSDASCVLYVDVDNFKAYNDRYGIMRGDRFLYSLGECLRKASEEISPSETFIGHVGGDDFIVVLPFNKAETFSCKTIEIFENHKTAHYDQCDLQNNAFISKSRDGQLTQFDLCTLSIAGISVKNCRFMDIYELTEHAARIKKICKSKSGHVIHID